MGQDKGGKYYREKIKNMWVMAAILFLLIGCFGKDERAIARLEKQIAKKEAKIKVLKERPKTAEDTQTVKTPPEWTVIKEWRGEGIKSTETFTTSTREWRIRWRTYDEVVKDGGVFKIYIYNAQHEVIKLGANKYGIGEDTFYMSAEPGRYSLEFNSKNIKWEVTVEEKR